MTPDKLYTWAMTAAPGKPLEYYRGRLAIDCQRIVECQAIRQAASELYMTGLFELAQTRIDERTFSYRIVRREKKDPSLRFWIRDPNKYGVGGPHRPARAGEITR